MILPVSVIGVQHVVPELAFERVGQLVQPQQLAPDGLDEHGQRREDDRDLRAQRRGLRDLFHRRTLSFVQDRPELPPALLTCSAPRASLRYRPGCGTSPS